MCFDKKQISPLIFLVPETTKLLRHGGCPIINFNLSSRRAFEEGWIVNKQPEPDVNKKNLLEWATNRLRIAIRERYIFYFDHFMFCVAYNNM